MSSASENVGCPLPASIPTSLSAGFSFSSTIELEKKKEKNIPDNVSCKTRLVRPSVRLPPVSNRALSLPHSRPTNISSVPLLSQYAAPIQSPKPPHNLPPPSPQKPIHPSKNAGSISNHTQRQPHEKNSHNHEEEELNQHEKVPRQQEFGVVEVVEGIELVQSDIVTMGEIVRWCHGRHGYRGCLLGYCYRTRLERGEMQRHCQESRKLDVRSL